MPHHLTTVSPRLKMPFPPDPTNAVICRLLRCTPPELRRLKIAFKSQLRSHHINGRPLLGQLPSESDPDGSVREKLWSTVTADDDIVGALLAGERYPAGARPRHFEEKVRVVKEKIWRDLTTTARRSGKRRSAARRAGRAGIAGSDAEGDLDVEDVRAPLERRSLGCDAAGGGRHGRGRVSQGSTDSADGSNRLPSPPTSEEPSEHSRSEAHVPAVSRQNIQQTPRRCPARRSSSGTVGGHTEGTTAILQGTSRELEHCVKALEEAMRQQEALVEDRVVRRVLGMLKERDRTIERLRWYLEGDA